MGELLLRFLLPAGGMEERILQEALMLKCLISEWNTI
ncbi:unnamed protein product [Acanthoscelides obtectus]|uniref:Uncharacterized protein n=1 Tax=Acanthoscelides obtectus TaxID=200917 RepID=A0A9P0L9Q0_ACAOB|nr:unnamed protein product [Acanthoscelides obtectus]CAK1635641.1 hypothetical protein AOBTE_LOCUS9411 [Acanthoscelides obtectus]